ncbi:MAG: hypothetical protein AB1772_11055 [Candidatus Zixiibacteriota bacterium]
MQQSSFSAIGYDLKSKYQRNMLVSLGIVTGLAVVLAVGVMFSQPVQSVRETEVTPQADRTVQVVEPDHGESMAARRSHGLNPYQGKHKGFAGFRGYNIIPDAPAMVHVQLPKLVTRDVVPTDADLPLDSIGSKNDTISEYAQDLTDYLPEDADMVPKRVVNREVELVTNVLPDVPWLAKDRDREGYVEVLMYVDSTGKSSPYSVTPQALDDSSGFFLDCVTKDGQTTRLHFFVNPVIDSNTLQYLIIKEEPREYGFAKNLTDVLPRWVFSPKIKDNQPVGTFVKIGFHYCDLEKDLDCMRITLIRS